MTCTHTLDRPREGQPPSGADRLSPADRRCTRCGERLNVCCRPGCSASYAPGPVLFGDERITFGWRRLSSLDLVVCPDHAPLWTASGDGRRDGPHCPTVAREGSFCACGEALAGLTGGDIADSYIAHLAAVLTTPG